MPEVSKGAALLHKVSGPDYRTWSTVDEGLRAATVGGARSAVLQDSVRSLEIGKQADLVLVDLDTMAFTPRQKLDNQLVYSENGSSINTVIVAGQVVVADERVTTIDEESVRAELNGRLVEIVAWQNRLDAQNIPLTEGLAKMYARAMDIRAPINRFSGSDVATLA